MSNNAKNLVIGINSLLLTDQDQDARSSLAPRIIPFQFNFDELNFLHPLFLGQRKMSGLLKSFELLCTPFWFLIEAGPRGCFVIDDRPCHKES